jgi:hypothetical protein
LIFKPLEQLTFPKIFLLMQLKKKCGRHGHIATILPHFVGTKMAAG